MDVYTVDFETYYDKQYSLSKMPTQAYIASELFEIIGVSIAKNDAPPVWYSFDWFTAEGVDNYADVLAPLDGAVVLAHNAAFDLAICHEYFDIVPQMILDTMSMARPLHGISVGGSLKALAQKYKIGEKGTEVVAALGKRRKDFTRDELAAYGNYCVTDVTLTRDLYRHLAKRTSRAELTVIDRTIRMFTEPKLELDAELLEEAIQEEREAKQRLVDECPVSVDQLMSNPKFADALMFYGVQPPMKTSPATGKETYAFAKSDAAFIDLQEHPNPMVRALVAARLASKSTLNETRMQKLIDLSKLGALRVPLRYCGALTTWRWSGEDGLNLQNLPNRGDNTIRRAMKAPRGHKLVVVDSSNIELRTNHCLAGQQDTIEKLIAGKDLYKDFAATLYGVPVDEVTKEQRFVGKVAHLSLGYGCGWRKFQDMVRQYGGSLSDEEAENIVTTWRKTFRQVVRSWYDGADQLLKAMSRGGDFALPSAPFVRTMGGLLITPPRHYIQYPKLRLREDGYVYDSKKYRTQVETKIYGGKTIENLCQHISRNILAEQLVTISDRYPVALMVHDEFVAVVPEDEAEEALEWMIEVMSTSPDWWPDIPLAAEGDIAERYGDAK